MIIAGGTEDSAYFTKGRSKIYSANVIEDGTITDWNISKAPITPTAFVGGAGQAGDRIFVLNEKEMFSAKFNEDGKLNHWKAEVYPKLGSFRNLFESSGHVIVLGKDGHTASSQIKSDETLGSWHLGSRFYGANDGYAVTIDKESGTIYVVGGNYGKFPIQKIVNVWSLTLK